MLATLSDDLNLDKIADIKDKVHDNNALANHNIYSQEKLCLIKMIGYPCWRINYQKSLQTLALHKNQHYPHNRTSHRKHLHFRGPTSISNYPHMELNQIQRTKEMATPASSGNDRFWKI